MSINPLLALLAVGSSIVVLSTFVMALGTNLQVVGLGASAYVIIGVLLGVASLWLVLTFFSR